MATLADQQWERIPSLATQLFATASRWCIIAIISLFWALAKTVHGFIIVIRFNKYSEVAQEKLIKTTTLLFILTRRD